MNVEEKTREIISKYTGIPEDEIERNSYLQDDLNMEPITLADLVVTLEDEFKIEIPPEESQKFKTVDDIINYIADKIGEI